MNYNEIIKELSDNGNVFKELLSGLTDEVFLWRPGPEKWCLLEIVCHLYDEELEDFRARTRHILETPKIKLTPIDPQGWVITRNYIQQNYHDKLNSFLAEREQSVNWLKAFSDPNWDNACEHPQIGKMTAKMILSNWLAHDYLHIRQIIKLKYDYLKQVTKEDLNYAGNW